MTGARPEGDFPTVELAPPLTQEQLEVNFAELPQWFLISAVYAAGHRAPAEAPESISKLTGKIEELELDGLSEEDLDQLLVSQEPRSIEEEEYMRLVNLKGGITSLAWTAMNASTLPANIKDEFTAKEGEHLAGREFDHALIQLDKWAEANGAEAEKPIEITDNVRWGIGRFCTRFSEIVEFYNEKRPIAAVYKILSENEGRYTMDDFDVDMWRFQVMLMLYGFTRAIGQWEKLLLDMGVSPDKIKIE